MFTQITKIIREGIESLLYNIDGHKRNRLGIMIYFVIIPLFIASYIIVKDIDTNSIIDTLLTCLSIFTALIFSVIFTVPDKLSKRISDLQNRNNEETHNYLIRFYNFSKLFVQQIAFVIVLCLLLISLLVLQKISNIEFVKFINSILFIVLIMYILQILSNIYILLNDDIDNSVHIPEHTRSLSGSLLGYKTIP